MKSRLAIWPLIIAGLFGASAAAAWVFLPTLDPSLVVATVPVVMNADLITLGLAGAALIFFAMSILLRKPVAPKNAGGYVAPAAARSNYTAPTPTSTGFGAAAAVAPSRAQARRAEGGKLTREDKKRLAQEEKFNKEAAKEAEKAAKAAEKARRKGKILTPVIQVEDMSVTATPDWINSIHAAQGVPTNDATDDINSTGRVVYQLDDAIAPSMAQPVVSPLYGDNLPPVTLPTSFTPPAAPTAPSPFGAGAFTEYPAVTDPIVAAPGAPLVELSQTADSLAPAQAKDPNAWLTAAYNDPTFTIPFSQMPATALVPSAPRPVKASPNYAHSQPLNSDTETAAVIVERFAGLLLSVLPTVDERERAAIQAHARRLDAEVTDLRNQIELLVDSSPRARRMKSRQERNASRRALEDAKDAAKDAKRIERARSRGRY